MNLAITTQIGQAEILSPFVAGRGEKFIEPGKRNH